MGEKQKVLVTLDVAQLLAQGAENVGNAFERGGAVMRANVDTMTHAIRESYEIVRQREAEMAALRGTVKELLTQVQEACSKTAELAILGANKEIALAEIKKQSEVLSKAFELLKEPIDRVTSRLLPTGEENKDGRGAVLRLFTKLLLDPANEELKDALARLAGDEDWQLILDLAKSFS